MPHTLSMLLDYAKDFQFETGVEIFVVLSFCTSLMMGFPPIELSV
jgi:hypothetical protein